MHQVNSMGHGTDLRYAANNIVKLNGILEGINYFLEMEVEDDKQELKG